MSENGGQDEAHLILGTVTSYHQHRLAIGPKKEQYGQMRVALISDLHGNAVALRAVLKALRSERVDRIACLGDVATLGPAPHTVR